MNARSTSKSNIPANTDNGGTVVKGDNGADSIAPEGQVEEQPSTGDQPETSEEQVEQPEQPTPSAVDLLKSFEAPTPTTSAFAAFLGTKSNTSAPRTPKEVLRDSIIRQINDSRTKDYSGPKWWADHEGQTALHVKLNNQQLKLPNGKQAMIIPTEQFVPVFNALLNAVDDGFFDDQIDEIGEKMRAKRAKAERTRQNKGK